jgi:hypothetical protein
MRTNVLSFVIDYWFHSRFKFKRKKKKKGQNVSIWKHFSAHTLDPIHRFASKKEKERGFFRECSAHGTMKHLDQRFSSQKKMLFVFAIAAVFVQLTKVNGSNPLIDGVTVTFTNSLNTTQSFVALLPKPRVLTLVNDYDQINPAWDCEFSERNCYHWDEVHDWGTHNLTITLEGYVTQWDTSKIFQTAVKIAPWSCAQVFIGGNLVQDVCGYPQFYTGVNASQFEWAEYRRVTSDLGGEGYDFGTIPVEDISIRMMNTNKWVRFQFLNSHCLTFLLTLSTTPLIVHSPKPFCRTK